MNPGDRVKFVVETAKAVLEGRISAEDGAAALGAKFGGVVNLFLKEFDLVAAEFLDVLASDGPLGLGEHPHLGAVLKAAFFLMHSSVDPVFKMFGDKSGEVFIHSTRLIERAGDDADAAIVLKQAVQKRGDCGQLSFASAAVGPDEAVAADAAASVRLAEGRENYLQAQLGPWVYRQDCQTLWPDVLRLLAREGYSLVGDDRIVAGKPPQSGAAESGCTRGPGSW